MEKSPVRWWDLPSAALLLIAILLVGWRLEATEWVGGLGHVRSLAVLGLFVGLALGQSNFQKRGVIVISLGYMLVAFCRQWIRFIEFGSEIPHLGDRLLILSGRLWVSMSDFISGNPVEDPLFLIALLSIPYWLAGLFSGYQMMRHASAPVAILPGGLLMFITHLNHYTELDYNWFFALYLFVSLLLISRLKYLTDKRNWARERVQIPGGSGFNLNMVTMTGAAVLVLLAWALPLNLPFNVRAKENWDRISGEWFSEGGETGQVFTFINRESLPPSPISVVQTELALGVQAPQSAFVRFVVYVPAAAQELPRLYWRGYVYDRYETGRWQSTELERMDFAPPDGEFKIPRWDQHTNLSFTFDVYERRQNIIYTPSQPLWVNHTAGILHTKTTGEDEALDVMILQASPPLEAGDIYRVTALLANPTIPELQRAGQEYPEWVAEKYLQLPEDFSPRIRELALEIAAPYDTPYDQALAVTNYLRDEIAYVTIVSPPQEGVDPLEYFLFESKQGFCNYYATAGVLMLRSLGIPARMVVGYAQGDPNLQNTLYTVRERDAHAWPEVYFPGYGWIEFEPTGNQEPLERPQERSDPEEISPNIPDNLPGPQLPFEGESESPLPAEELTTVMVLSPTQRFQLGALAGLLLLAGVLLLLRRKYTWNIQAAVVLKAAFERSGWETPAWLNAWNAWTSLTSIERYFQSVNISLRWMGEPQPVHVTAAERAALLKKSLPAASPSIETLLHELESELFSPQEGDPLPARRAAWIILYQTLRARLRIFILGYN
jgi:transglutaminase-like putative cysteine protease